MSLFNFAVVIVVLAAPAAWAQSSSYCPEKYGVQTYANEEYCDKFYKVSRRKKKKSGLFCFEGIIP